MKLNINKVTNKALQGHLPSDDEALTLTNCDNIDLLTYTAATMRDHGHGSIITYSPKVIIPFTSFCNAEWDYCTLSNPFRNSNNIYLEKQEILNIAQRGLDAGCYEVLFFLSTKPEQWSEKSKSELKRLGYKSTLDYLIAMAEYVYERTGMLPKLHSGVLNRNELSHLRSVSLAQGLMLDSRAEYLCEESSNSYGATNQNLYVRLGVAAAAGAVNIPFTSGIVIGLGESRRERIDALLGLRHLNETFGHLQEIVIQNYRHEVDIKGNRISKSMLQELLWTIAVSRIIFGPDANIQAPADLPMPALSLILNAGINDWGSVIPTPIGLTGKGAPWLQLEVISEVTKKQGKQLHTRLPLYPSYVKTKNKWLDEGFHKTVTSLTNSQGFPLSEFNQKS